MVCVAFQCIHKVVFLLIGSHNHRRQSNFANMPCVNQYPRIVLELLDIVQLPLLYVIHSTVLCRQLLLH